VRACTHSSPSTVGPVEVTWREVVSPEVWVQLPRLRLPSKKRQPPGSAPLKRTWTMPVCAPSAASRVKRKLIREPSGYDVTLPLV